VTEDKLIVRIPMLISMRVVGVELELTSVLVQVEHVRIAIAVSYVHGTINATVGIAHPLREVKDNRLYFMCDRESPVPHTKCISFLDMIRILRIKP
jgi:hypothetical protein